MITYNDPKCIMDVHGKLLAMPLSHSLPLFVAENPYYDSIIERISSYIRATYGTLNYIDIGANIGDTILFTNPQSNDRFLAIEASKTYYEYLLVNTKLLHNINTINSICSSSDSEVSINIHHSGGTARILHTNGIVSYQHSLDTIVNDLLFVNVNLIKIDTDGYDLEIIKGAINTITNMKPTILFECDDFGDERFIDNLIEVFDILKIAGYKNALLYDNRGYLYSEINFCNPESYKYSIIHKLLTNCYYFDVLTMPPLQLSQFVTMENDLFCSHIPKIMNINKLGFDTI